MSYPIGGDPDRYRAALDQIHTFQARWERWAIIAAFIHALNIVVLITFVVGLINRTAFVVLFLASLVPVLPVYLNFGRKTQQLLRLHREAVMWMPVGVRDDDD